MTGITASPLCVGFEPDAMVLLFLASSSYFGNRMLSAQLHGKQLAPGSLEIVCGALSTGELEVEKINE